MHCRKLVHIVSRCKKLRTPQLICLFQIRLVGQELQKESEIFLVHIRRCRRGWRHFWGINKKKAEFLAAKNSAFFVGGAYCTKFEPILKVIQTRNKAPASGLPSADTEKNVPDNFGFGARQKNFLKRTGHFFGVLPSRSRAGLKTQKNKMDWKPIL